MNTSLSNFLAGLAGAAVFFGIWALVTPSYLRDDSKAETAHFSEAQKSEIHRITGEYLSTNPQVFVKAFEQIQHKRVKSESEKSFKNVAENYSSLVDSKNLEFGNPKGDIVLVEFLDYQCVHCKNMEAAINDLVKSNPNLRVVIKSFPIFGENSNYAAKAVMAAQKQDKFVELHNALLKEKSPLTNDKVLEIAKENGLDVDQLKIDVVEFDEQLKDSKQLGAKLSIKGTPYLILLKQTDSPKDLLSNQIKVIPGESSKDALQQHIDSLKK